MRTANPVFRNDAFAPSDWRGLHADRAAAGVPAGVSDVPAANVMTLRGTVIKTGVLLALCVASACLSWALVSGGTVPPGVAVMGGFVVGVICALVLTFVPKASPALAPVYALAEGALLGAISLMVAKHFGKNGAMATGLIMQAVGLTFGIFATMLVGFGSGLLRLGSTATKCVVAATGGLCLLYLVNMVLRMFNINAMPFIHEGGAIGIGFSLFVIVLASLNLVLDFQHIEQGVANRAPKHMEWYGGFALLVTLVWLYIEILRLLIKLRQK